MIKIGISIKNGTIDESFVSGGNHNVELYVIDWDCINSGKQSSIEGWDVQHISMKRFNEIIQEANCAIDENKE